MHPFGRMRSEKRTLAAVFGFLGSLALSSCGGSDASTGPGVPTVGVPDATSLLSPTFSSLRENVFGPKCMECHGAGFAAAGVDFSSYERLMGSAHRAPLVTPGKPEESRLWEVLSEGRMPPNGAKLSVPELDAIRSWILNGAKDD